MYLTKIKKVSLGYKNISYQSLQQELNKTYDDITVVGNKTINNMATLRGLCCK